jgi:hypothetical protein
MIIPLLRFLPLSADVVDATFSADESTLSVLLRDGAGQMSVARGQAGGKLTPHPLPPEVRGVAFVDARRGIAIGKHLGQVWTTIEGADRWSRLTVPMDGDPAAVPLVLAPTCSMLECSSGTTVVWTSPRALREVGYRQPPVIGPGHLSGDRGFGGPGPRNGPRLEPLYPEMTKPVCPNGPPAKSTEPKRPE